LKMKFKMAGGLTARNTRFLDFARGDIVFDISDNLSRR